MDKLTMAEVNPEAYVLPGGVSETRRKGKTLLKSALASLLLLLLLRIALGQIVFEDKLAPCGAHGPRL